MTLRRYSSGTIMIHGNEFDVLLQESADGQYILYSDHLKAVRKAVEEKVSTIFIDPCSNCGTNRFITSDGVCLNCGKKGGRRG